MMYTIRKKFKFEMAHVLTNSYSQECQSIHGHSYVLEILIEAATVNKSGMVIDFKLLKEIVQEKVINKFDHAFVFQFIEKDERSINSRRLTRLKIKNSFGQSKVVLTKYNPTAELMARDIYNSIIDDLKKEVATLVLLSVRLHETETGYAEYTGGF